MIQRATPNGHHCFDTEIFIISKDRIFFISHSQNKIDYILTNFKSSKMSKGFNLVDLPFAPIGNSSFLPNKAGVYIVCTDSNQVIYVGKTKSIRERHQSHERFKDFLKHKATKICFDISDPNIDVLELKYIKYYNPPLNTQGVDVILSEGDPTNILIHYRNLNILSNDIAQEITSLRPQVILSVDKLGTVKPPNKCKGYVLPEGGKFRIQNSKDIIYSDKVNDLDKKYQILNRELLKIIGNKDEASNKFNSQKLWDDEIEDLKIQRAEIDEQIESIIRQKQTFTVKEEHDAYNDYLARDKLLHEHTPKCNRALGELTARQKYENDNGISYCKKTLVFSLK